MPPSAGRFLEPFPDDEKRSYVSLETMIRIIEGNHTYDSTKSYVSSEQIIRIIRMRDTDGFINPLLLTIQIFKKYDFID